MPTIDHSKLVRAFYTSFQNKDYKTMQSLYHPDATFSDPVFQNLTSGEVKAMWQMLIGAGKDLRILFSDIRCDGDQGSCHWEAFYTFSRTGKTVHNIIDTQFEFVDGAILRHRDHFNFWRWSRQAFGLTGLAIGWTPFFHNKVSQAASSGLQKFMTGSRI